MSKPICKAECDYEIWRPEINCYEGFSRFEKKIMKRARRRFNKEIIHDEIQSSNN